MESWHNFVWIFLLLFNQDTALSKMTTIKKINWINLRLQMGASGWTWWKFSWKNKSKTSSKWGNRQPNFCQLPSRSSSSRPFCACNRFDCFCSCSQQKKGGYMILFIMSILISKFFNDFCIPAIQGFAFIPFYIPKEVFCSQIPTTYCYIWCLTCTNCIPFLENF